MQPSLNFGRTDTLAFVDQQEGNPRACSSPDRVGLPSSRSVRRGKREDLYLSCKNPQGGGAFLTIDYDASTVITASWSDLKPVADYQGRTAQPAQVSDSEIAWQYKLGIQNRLVTVSLRLNRKTGILTYRNDNVPGLDEANCELAEKPANKF